MPETSETLELFSAQVCPYAHRTRLVLAEKNADFILSEIDLKDKPQRFLDISRYGKVPALLHRGHALVESTIVNQYIDDILPEPALSPSDPSLKARMRIWIDYFDRIFLDLYYNALVNQDRAKDSEYKEDIQKCLLALEHQSLAERGDSGPYWLGNVPTLIDFAIYPFFERFPALSHYRGIDIPDECVKLKAWIDVMSKRQSVVEIANSEAFYIERYKGYAGAD
jgi:glutathione S-transferase